MENIIIRRIELQDYVQLEELILFRSIAKTVLKHKRLQKYCFVAVDIVTSTAIGFILGELSIMDACIIWNGEVKEEYQKRGVFSSLLKAIEASCKGKTIILFNHIELDEFYRKRGYELGDQLHVHIKQEGINFSEISEFVNKTRHQSGSED